MKLVKRVLTKDLLLGELRIKSGSEVDTYSIGNKKIIVFVRNGWWCVSDDYFRYNLKNFVNGIFNGVIDEKI